MPRHPLSIAGIWLTTLSAFVFLFVFVIDLFALHSNPYVGLVFFVIVPMFFVLGLLLIPAGIVLEHRRRRRGLEPRPLPRIDLNNPIHQRTIVIVLALTIANVLIVSLAAYRGVEYMESPEFCGRACHKVMEPEYLAHKDGPHSRVTCVECHVGSGAQSYVYYKLNGMRQLAHFVAGSYPKPVPSPVFNLRPARGTCEMCHWPEKFHGDKVEVVPEYASDEKNTSNSTRMVLHVGGGLPQFGLGAGIHWHTNPQIEIDFVATDAKRQEIPYVRMKDAAGQVHEYRAPDADAAKIAAGDRRRMDCVDCHNRPTHDFFATPERAVDFAIARGSIASDLPFVRREAVAALKATYPDGAAADRDIEKRLRSFYATAHGEDAPPNAAQLDRLVASAQFLYGRNVFPSMNVTWGTHLSNLGHTDAPGCFRCHDDQHKSADGRAIRQDCDLCHEIQ